MPRGRPARARRAHARARRGDLRARACGPRAIRGAGALPHGSAVAADRNRKSRVAASIGTTSPSSGRTRSWLVRCSAPRRAYAAVAPLVGISVVTQVELGNGLRVRAGATGELAQHWPEARGACLSPPGLGGRNGQLCRCSPSWKLRRAGGGRARRAGRARRRRHGDPARDRRARLGRPGAVRAARLAPVQIRPRCCRSRPPSLPVSPRVSTRFARSWQGSCSSDLLLADGDPPLAEALNRWGLVPLPERAVPLRAAPRLARERSSATRGRCGPLSSSVARRRSRRAVHAALRSLADGGACLAVCGRRSAPRARRGTPRWRPADARGLARRRAPRAPRRRRRVDAPNSLIRDEAVSVSSQERR